MTSKSQTFVPAVIAANLGSYSIGRAFHEAYGLKTELLCGVEVFPIKHSSLFNVHADKDLHYNTRDALKRFKEKLDYTYPDKQKLLIGSDDYSLGYIIKNKDLFDENWLMPYVDFKEFVNVADKEYFYQLCESLNISHPKSWVLEKDTRFPEDASGRLVIKPSFNDYFEASVISDIDKIYFTDSHDEAKETVSMIRQKGYNEKLVLQTFIDGKDTDQAVVTTYRRLSDKTVPFMSFGRILLEDRSPKRAGNHLTILTEDVPEQVKEDIHKILSETDFVGFANFDLIFDNHTGEWNFFELNPRPGYSSYQVTANGYNVAKVYAEDMLGSLTSSDFERRDIIYTVLPNSINKSELSGQYLDTFKKYHREKRVVHPLYYDKDKRPVRLYELLKARRRATKEFSEGR